MTIEHVIFIDVVWNKKTSLQLGCDELNAVNYFYW